MTEDDENDIISLNILENELTNDFAANDDVQSRIFYGMRKCRKESSSIPDETNPKQSLTLIQRNSSQNTEEDSPYELIHRGSFNISRNERVSISRIHRRRPKGKDIKSMYVVGDSMVAFKDGIPGSFSPLSVHSTRRNVKSVPVFPQEITLEPERPPRKNRLKFLSNQQARIYDQVYEEDMRNSSSSSNESTDDAPLRNIIISSGTPKVETGIRIFDPDSAQARRQSKSVILPISLNDDLSESEESWGSEFEDVICEDEEVYEVLGKPNKGVGSIDSSNYERIESFGIEPSKRPKPPLPPRQSFIFQSLEKLDLDKDTYVQVNMDDELIFPAVLPPLDENSDEFQLKRYQIVKCILENEKLYMKSLNRLIKDYEEPLLTRNIISQDRIKVIFKHVHEIIQCHQLFSMALSDRTKEWISNDVIGDVIYASFSKSMVLKAYTSFVHNFSYAMESIKETCKLVPAFLSFLKKKAGISSYYTVIKNSAKNHLNRNSTKQSLYDLMRQPLERIPQLVTLTQELTKITPLLHPDHFPLQMALTHLECFSEALTEKKRDSMYKHKVRQLDNYCIGLEKPLSSKSRYYVRHDDMLLCILEDRKVVKTKLRRLFILNDLLICAGILSKPKKLKSLTSKKFQIKWCVPINDVEILDVGSGISFQSERNSLTTKYSHVSSPRPGVGDASKVLEDLQHDIEVIGDIVGKVSSLRRKYRTLFTVVIDYNVVPTLTVYLREESSATRKTKLFIDIKKVTQWYNDVKAYYERERELVNMNWIEIAIPSKNPRSENIRYLFNVHSSDKRSEWLAELENVKLRLTHNNNPGWYLQEDNIYDGEAAVLRRTLPLLSNLVPMFLVDNKQRVTCSLEVSMTTALKPIIWLFSGNNHVGIITSIEMDMSNMPHATESFEACNTRICCAERVPEEGCYSMVPFIPNVSVWLGTMAGRVLLFDPNVEKKYPSLATTLKDAVISLKYSRNRVFAGLANGTMACFRRKVDGSWDLKNPTIVCLDTTGVMFIAEVVGHLWCACGNTIYVVNTVTLAIERKLTVEEGGVKNLVAYGIGVWVSSKRSSKLQLYHAETLDQLQIINVATAIQRMKDDIDINVEKIIPEKLYVTSLMARSGLLWVGTDQGLVLTYPLPKLGGIPKVNGSACISFHGHEGPVRHLYAFKMLKNVTQQQQQQQQQQQSEQQQQQEDHEHQGENVRSANNGKEKSQSRSTFYMNTFEGDEVNDLGLSIENLDAVGVGIPPDPLYFEVESEEMFKLKNESQLFASSDERVGEVEDGGTCVVEESKISEHPGDKDEDGKLQCHGSEGDAEKSKLPCGETERKEGDKNVDVEKPKILDDGTDVISDNDRGGDKVILGNESVIQRSHIDKSDNDNGSISHERSDEEVLIKDAPAGALNKENNNVFTGEVVDVDVEKCSEVGEKRPTISNLAQNIDQQVDDVEMIQDCGVSNQEFSIDENRVEEEKTKSCVQKEREAVVSSTPNKALPMEPLPPTTPFTSHHSYLDMCLDEQFKGDDVYESPIPPDTPGGYASVKKENRSTISSEVSSTDLNDTMEMLRDHYRTLPLPHSPWHSLREDGSKSAGATPPPLNPKNYTSLIENDREPSFSGSFSSGIGLNAYERELSFGVSSAPNKADGDGQYTSLVEHSKREADARTDALLKPCYVISIGVGHVDFRKASKRGSKTAEFFRSIAPGNSQLESMLVAWKIC